MGDTRPARPAPPGRDSQKKKPYTTPRLVTHGTVEEMTQAAVGAPTDALLNGSVL